jgi:hypothetical protein
MKARAAEVSFVTPLYRLKRPFLSTKPSGEMGKGQRQRGSGESTD